MNKLLSLILLSTLLLNAGCAYSHRHPKQIKIGIFVVGAAAGVGIGLATHQHSCPYDNGGSGTTCPYKDKDK
jgi:hypothetical protein